MSSIRIATGFIEDAIVLGIDRGDRRSLPRHDDQAVRSRCSSKKLLRSAIVQGCAVDPVILRRLNVVSGRPPPSCPRARQWAFLSTSALAAVRCRRHGMPARTDVSHFGLVQDLRRPAGSENPAVGRGPQWRDCGFGLFDRERMREADGRFLGHQPGGSSRRAPRSRSIQVVTSAVRSNRRSRWRRRAMVAGPRGDFGASL
jgi:hypothetical protein